jgi:hypothetical protein
MNIVIPFMSWSLTLEGPCVGGMIILDADMVT